MGGKTMKPALVYDKATDVAFFDVCEMPEAQVRVDVIDVTEMLGFTTQVLARVDENGHCLGLILQDFTRFKRELRRMYWPFKVDRLLELIVSKVREVISPRAACPAMPELALHT